METQYKHILLVTPAMIEEDGSLDQLDRSYLNTYCFAMAENKGLKGRNVLFITQGNLASIETAHHMGDLLCCWKCHSRQFLPRQNFWMRETAEQIVSDMCRREMFEADLWVFVGHIEHLLCVMQALVPMHYAEMGPIDPHEIPSASLMGFTIKEERLLGIPATMQAQ